mmetsp:Transcript_67400/g.99902  ORF Transcript_67400/g.99902 Transcript_67400/m.99902 type:complete len:234 (+) Transcript_67400:104-805(+)
MTPSIMEYFLTISKTLVPFILIPITLFFLLYLFIKPGCVDPNLPGPKRSRFLGISFGDDLDGETFEWTNWPPLCLHLSRRYNYKNWGGPTPNIGFGPAFYILITEDAIRHILRDNASNYVKSDTTKECLQEMFGDGILNVDGDLWKKHRMITTSLFTKDFVRYGAKVTAEKAEQVSSILDKLAETNEKEDSAKEECKLLSSSSSSSSRSISSSFFLSAYMLHFVRTCVVGTKT